MGQLDAVGPLVPVDAGPTVRRSGGHEVERLLSDDADVLGWCFASPVALAPAALPAARRPRLASICRAVTRERTWRRRVAGRRGTLARRVPRDRGWYLVLTVTARRVSLWDLGVTQRRMPDAPVLSFPRSSLTSVHRTGGADDHGIDARFRFVDGSFVDLKLYDGAELKQFWSAVARR